MKIRKGFSPGKERVVLTIGFFDGVHLGHQKIIGDVVKEAKLRGIKSCVVTLDRHPSKLFSHRSVPLLTSQEEKERIMYQLGVDLVQIFPFTLRFASLSPYQFLCKLKQSFNFEQIIVGEDFVFGQGRKGNVKLLHQVKNDFGYELVAIPSLKLKGEKISSSLLRQWLGKGEIEKVTRWMGRYPTILGEVIEGDRRGRTLGYPTANLRPHPQKLLPSPGVYAGKVKLMGKTYRTLINVGDKPTFKDFSRGIEAHIFDFSKEIYGQSLRIELVSKIRDIQTFSSSLELISRLEKDKEEAERIVEIK
ncbi:bifunctional riboflavin kinase/FAD synthetase [Candidatus Aerophobetes bacterium]|nr:bifunctional riboflavin kinase/FAD synthetase [Candidatus Aerophobetes bacterium]